MVCPTWSLDRRVRTYILPRDDKGVRGVLGRFGGYPILPLDCRIAFASRNDKGGMNGLARRDDVPPRNDKGEIGSG